MKIDTTQLNTAGLKLIHMRVGEVYERMGASCANRFYLAVGPTVALSPTTIVNLGTGCLLTTVDDSAEFRHVPDAALTLP